MFFPFCFWRAQVQSRITRKPPSGDKSHFDGAGQNRKTANVWLVSSVGRAHQSGGRRLKSRSRQIFFVHPKFITIIFQQNCTIYASH